MKTKIVHVTQSLGGIRTYLESLIIYSTSEKFEHVVVAPEHFEFQKFCEIRDIRYHPVKIQRSINPIRDLYAFFQILSILRTEKPDIIQTHSAKGGFIGRLAAKFTSAKVIYTPHGFSYLSFKGLKRVIFYMIECIAKAWTDILLTVSYSEASRAVHEVGYDDTHVRTILNSVHVNSPLAFRNYHRCINIGMIGRLTHQKNPLLYLNVALALTEKYPHLKFSILGAGMTDHLTCEIEDFIEKNSLRDKVQILNWGEIETSRKFLFDIDIFVMTSVFEGLPFSLIEAMSFGLPSVVTKVDGNTDVIQNNENGFACITVEEFTDKISALVESEELRRTLGQAGNRYVKQFHEVQKNTMKLERLYQEIRYGLRTTDWGGDAVGLQTEGQIGRVNLNATPGI